MSDHKNKEPLTAVGYEPVSSLNEEQKNLFQSFQRNLLSLVSHELRTPLSGVMNSLSLLEDLETEGSGPLSRGELLVLARSSVNRLKNTLASLLDLAEIESNVFHSRLREVNLLQWLRQWGEQNREASVNLSLLSKKSLSTPVLADPSRLTRALDLGVQTLNVYCLVQGAHSAETKISIDLSETETQLKIVLRKKIDRQQKEAWEQLFLQAEAGFRSGILSPGSVFSGTIQSEEAFLVRLHEGLGGELVLVHEIMKQHQGVFSAKVISENEQDCGVEFIFELPQLSSEESLKVVLSSRLSKLNLSQGAMGSVALLYLGWPGESSQWKTLSQFRSFIQEKMFRASDAVYSLPRSHRLALVLDDFKLEDQSILLTRLSGIMHGSECMIQAVASPEEGSDAEELLRLLETRWQTAFSSRSQK